jgi:crotonobetainyl-CoA:carnitine CoA-transferase CaiB-like acyl-CoA transferase
MTALDGLRVLDMTQWEAGTSCTQALAWLGADVVKVEQPDIGDPGRSVGGATDGKDAEYFVNWNSNKRSVTLNLSDPAGRQLLLDMVPNFDVFIENYGPGVVEKLDIGYEVMAGLNPGIIYARIKGFGTSGPRANHKCMDMVAQAAAGAFSITGEPGGPPMRPGPTTGDSGTGTQAALAVVAAYVQKLRTGEGQVVELAMQEAMTYYMRSAVSRTRFGEVPTPRLGGGDNPFVSLYPCAPGGPNDYVFVMAVNRRMWQGVADAIGVPALMDDARFADARSRHENRAALGELIGAWARERTKTDAMYALAEAGVCASEVLETHELFTDPHLLARGFVHEVIHPQHGKVKLLGWPARLSKSEVAITPAPLLGQHTDEILEEVLELSADQIAGLREAGAIGNEMSGKEMKGKEIKGKEIAK